jgi:hypothetical protein
MTENEVYQKYIKPYYSHDTFVFKVDHERLPDVYIAYHMDDEEYIFWIEIKVIKSIPKNYKLKPKWRQGQLSWIKEQKDKGGVDNVSLILYYEPLNECRLYQTCKKVYDINEEHTIIKRGDYGPF